MTGVLVFVWGKVRRALEARPAWTLETDELGRTFLTYQRRKPAFGLDATFIKGGQIVQTGPVASIAEPCAFGTRGEISVGLEWDEFVISWYETNRNSSTSVRPGSGTSSKMYADVARPKLLHRIGRFLQNQ